MYISHLYITFKKYYFYCIFKDLVLFFKQFLSFFNCHIQFLSFLSLCTLFKNSVTHLVVFFKFYFILFFYLICPYYISLAFFVCMSKIPKFTMNCLAVLCFPAHGCAVFSSLLLCSQTHRQCLRLFE